VKFMTILLKFVILKWFNSSLLNLQHFLFEMYDAYCLFLFHFLVFRRVGYSSFSGC
jgi:hypothetical protein